MRSFWRLLALLFVPACLAAQEPLTLAEAARRTLQQRPEFRVHAARLDSLAAQRAQAALAPGYRLEIELQDVLGSGELRGLEGAELGLGLGGSWERGGKRAARIALAERGGDLLAAEQQVLLLDLVAETARLFVALAVAQQRLADARAAVEHSTRSLRLTRQRHAAAQAPETEVLNASIALAEAELALEHAAHGLALAQQLLGAQWNAPDSAPLARFDVHALAPPPALDELLARLDDVPDLARYASEARVAEAELALARSQASADLGWTAGVRRLQELDDQALLFSVSLPLGTAARARPLIGERTARLAQVEAEREVARQRLEMLLRRQLLALQVAHASARSIGERQLQPARAVVEQTRRGFGIGRFAWRELAAAERQLRELQRQQLEAAATYHFTRVEIERLTGVLPVAATTPEPRHD